MFAFTVIFLLSSTPSNVVDTDFSVGLVYSGTLMSICSRMGTLYVAFGERDSGTIGLSWIAINVYRILPNLKTYHAEKKRYVLDGDDA